MLHADEIEQFIHDGLVKIEGAFSREAAAACREILWRDLGLSPERPDQWMQPVMRLGMYADPPFRDAASSPRLHAALDQLVGHLPAVAVLVVLLALFRIVLVEIRAKHPHQLVPKLFQPRRLLRFEFPFPSASSLAP